MEVYYKLARDLFLSFYTLTFLLIVSQVGCRWETGTDWIPYLTHFESIDDIASTSPLNTGMEYGYSILCWFVKVFTDKYSVLLIVHSLIYYFLIFKGIKQLSPYFFICILLFYAFTMGVLGSHRQLLAIAIVLFSFKYIINKSPYMFCLCVACATVFHTTAIICLPLYFLNINIKEQYLLGIVVLAFLLGKTSLPGRAFEILGNIGGLGNKVMIYLEGGIETAKDYGVSLAGLLKRIIFVALFIYTKRNLDVKLANYSLMLNTYIVGICLYFLFSSSLTILVSRGSLYFNMFEPILISCQILLIKKDKERVFIIFILFVLSVLYFFQSIAQYPDLFLPYKGLYINEGFRRELS